MVADLCVVGGYSQYAIRPARFLVPVPDGNRSGRSGFASRSPISPLSKCSPACRSFLAGRDDPYHRRLGHRSAQRCWIWRAFFGLKAIGTCFARPAYLSLRASVQRRSTIVRGDFTTAVPRSHRGARRRTWCGCRFSILSAARHFGRSFTCLTRGGLLVGYGSQNHGCRARKPRISRPRHGRG